ncbi:MAG: iron-sulfur cluster assembly scaffold protein [Candidatus Diapherotrites archaeon]|nr:iron-sulfur cluster assembly scaffold protein [Candidatus Diapherotrites archaeon]
MYTDKVIEHFRNPRNYGKMENPDGFGRVGNPTCGDVMELYIKVEKDNEGNEIIKDVSFLTYGCAAAIATSSVLTGMIKGKELKGALKVKDTDIAKELGGLPPVKMHCSLLATKALKAAVDDYRNH